MHHREQLESLASGAKPLPHTFLRSEGDSDTVALLFPGYGYRALQPLLNYAEQALLWRGADVLRLELAYDLEPSFAAAEPAVRRGRIREDAGQALAAALAAGTYRQVVLVGKSMGTLALAELVDAATTERVPACAWLTPLLNDAGLRDSVRTHRPPSLFVIGTADPLYDAAVLAELNATAGGRSVVVDGADHSMLVAGDMAATMEGLRAVMAGFEDLLDDAGVTSPG